ncbi:Transcription initiation factor TFIIIB, Bdp1 subunit [Phaffia rhodozyma]|uniref:Transcription initiation factor TFIIIB, Bdp1 subunit n=1 Tax=Phaffia rhodozyma TaxID=264483 RepID=A0A0F7SEI4_PHARH|nr:Transcription initiation factor TFIIIB, Bdp1 subunit [Phaffia rhodozyma]
MSRIDKGAPRFKIAPRGASRTPRPSASPAPALTHSSASGPLNSQISLASPVQNSQGASSTQPPLPTPPSTILPSPSQQTPITSSLPSPPLNTEPQPLPPHKPHNPYLDVLAPPPIPTSLSLSKNAPSFGSPLIPSRTAPVRQFRPQKSSISARSTSALTSAPSSPAFLATPAKTQLSPHTPSRVTAPLSALTPSKTCTSQTNEAPTPSSTAQSTDFVSQSLDALGNAPEATASQDSASVDSTPVLTSSQPSTNKRPNRGVLKRVRSLLSDEEVEAVTLAAPSTPVPSAEPEESDLTVNKTAASGLPPTTARNVRRTRPKKTNPIVSSDAEEEAESELNGDQSISEAGRMDVVEEGDELEIEGAQNRDSSVGEAQETERKKAIRKVVPKPRTKPASKSKGVVKEKEKPKLFLEDEAEDGDEEEVDHESEEQASSEVEQAAASKTPKPVVQRKKSQKPKDDPLDPVRKGKRVSRKSRAATTQQESRLGAPPPLTATTAEEHNASLPPPPDASVMLMSDIISDNGFGRVSSRFLDIRRKALEIKTNRVKARERMKSQARKAQRLRDGILGEDTDDEDGVPLQVDEPGLSTSIPSTQRNLSSSSAKSHIPSIFSGRVDVVSDRTNEPVAGPSNSNSNPSTDTIISAVAADKDDISDISDVEDKDSNYAAQIRIVNGQMVIDQNSLVVDQHAREEKKAGIMETVEERDTDRFVNSATWGRKPRGERWSKEETDLFYDAIRQFGTDFEMIARLFPGRTRKMIKNKWNREERFNDAAVSHALMARLPVDMRTYARMTNTDLSGPPPEIRMPTPPPFDHATSLLQSKPMSNVLSKKKKRTNTRDGEEVVGTVGEDGEELRLSDDGLNMDEFE